LPALRLDAELVVPPLDHEYVYGVTPPDVLTVALPVAPPLQRIVELIVIAVAKLDGWVIVVDADAVEATAALLQIPPEGYRLILIPGQWAARMRPKQDFQLEHTQ